MIYLCAPNNNKADTMDDFLSSAKGFVHLIKLNTTLDLIYFNYTDKNTDFFYHVFQKNLANKFETTRG